VKAVAPEDDLYDLTNYLRGFDRHKHRDGVKTVFNSLIFGGAMGKRLPDGAKEHLPKKTSVEAIRTAIAAKHQPLAPILGKVIGYDLMYAESEILVLLLCVLIDRGITALPLHDGILVAKSKAQEAKKVMEDIAEHKTGTLIPVSVKEASG
jgi:hypothetical protein